MKTGNSCCRWSADRKMSSLGIILPMPTVPFDKLPSNARVWVFASDRPLVLGEADVQLAEVDRFLDQWKAHGAPLRSASEWREDRFLAIGGDPTAQQASGDSIGGTFPARAQV